MFKKLNLFISILFFFFLVLVYFYSCKPISTGDSKGKIESYPYTDSNWINWNIALAPTTSKPNKDLIQELEDSLTNYVHRTNPNTTLKFTLKSCPCDTSLTNIKAAITYASGNTVPAPPTTPQPVPTGDYTLGKNLVVYNPEFKDSTHYDTSISYTSPIHFKAESPSSPSHKVLAVIDTGLDTLRFNNSFPNTNWGGNLLWQDTVRATLFNVVPGESEDQLIDNTNVKHGTVVTDIILTQLSKIGRNNIPQIMSIRAFDKSEQGSIYTVSCALSYAIQNNVDFINASWGYFGKVDSVLLRYLQKANDKSIRIIAAAGNTPFQHNAGQICSLDTDNLNSLNRLKSKDSLFYPAAYAPTISNLVSVTQVHQTNTSPNPLDLKSCFYQNFSPDYITVGAFEKTPSAGDCCKFRIPFLKQPVEGSSFATPVLTALFMNQLQNRNQDIKLFIDNSIPKGDDKRFTLKGNYHAFIQVP